MTDLGTNLQALIDHVKNPSKRSSAEIVLVISNKAGVKGLERAEAAGIPTKVRGNYLPPASSNDISCENMLNMIHYYSRDSRRGNIIGSARVRLSVSAIMAKP